MPERVVSENEVSLNAVRFPIIGRVVHIPNALPEKQVFGDYTRDSNPRLSSVTFSDFRGGALLDTMQGNQTNRCWTSTSNIRVQRQLTLPPLRTDVTDISASPPNDEANTINQHNILLVISFGDNVYSYNNSAFTSQQNMASEGFNSIAVFMGGTEYVVIGRGSAYDYWDGTTWSQPGSGGGSDGGLAFWDNRLWGIDTSGNLFYSIAIGTNVAVAVIPTPLGSTQKGMVTSLSVMEVLGGAKALHATINTGGLWAYDAANDIWIDTEIKVPREVTIFEGHGQFITNWRGNTYIASGLAVWERSIQSGTVVLRSVGLDQDDGIEILDGARISDIVSTANELIVSVSHDDTGAVHPIYSWDGRGWYQMGETATHVDEVFTLFPSLVFDTYRLYIGARNSISHLPLYEIGENPKQITGYTYAASSTLKTPWFHAARLASRNPGWT